MPQRSGGAGGETGLVIDRRREELGVSAETGGQAGIGSLSNPKCKMATSEDRGRNKKSAPKIVRGFTSVSHLTKSPPPIRSLTFLIFNSKASTIVRERLFLHQRSRLLTFSYSSLYCSASCGLGLYGVFRVRCGSENAHNVPYSSSAVFIIHQKMFKR